MTQKITLVEVGPRDGLQNESVILDQPTRLAFIKKLSQTGLKRVEIGAFVSPKKVPQMAETFQLAQKVLLQQNLGKISQRIRFSVLVPNARGMHQADLIGIKEVAFFTAVSTTFTQKNINCSVQESFKRLKDIKKIISKKCYLRGYISTAFYCPYEGYMKPRKVVDLAGRLLDMGCYEISIGDTIGAATPKEVNQLLSMLLKEVSTGCISMHFHDTRGIALANIKESLDHGIRIFDSSLGGLGGCPYAKSPTGNVATEDVVYFVERLGYKTGVDIQMLLKINHWLEKKLQHPLPSKVGYMRS